MATLHITVGLPASGKTSFARTLQPGVVRVNRDDLRDMLHGTRRLDRALEVRVTVAQRAAVTALLTAGVSVMVDDTNLRPEYRQQWAEVAANLGAAFEVHDFTDVPVDECIRRDAGRRGRLQVGARVIRDMAARWLSHRTEVA